MTGRRLRRLAKKWLTKDKVVLAFEIATGKVVVERHTFGQTAALLGDSRSYVTAYAGLEPTERVQFMLGKVTPHEALDRIIEKFGLEAVWKALESKEAAWLCANLGLPIRVLAQGEGSA
jgi:hypothetical protein